MADSNRRGWMAQMFWLVLSFSLMTGGCRNYRVRTANTEVHKIAMKTLVTKPSETSVWVETSGEVVAGSSFQEGSDAYIILLDPGSKTAALVRLAKESPLKGTQGPNVVVKGMAESSERKEPPPRRGLAQDVKFGNLIIAENESPPGFWSSEFLVFLGFIFLGGASPKKD